MVQANYIFLTERFVKFGFEDGLYSDPLRKGMEMGLNKIELKSKNTQKDGEFEFNVIVEKGKTEKLEPGQEPFWFINKIDVAFKKNDGSKIRRHTFSLYNQNGFKVDQMINLMKGNYVHKMFRSKKTGELVGVWQSVDFNRVDDNGNTTLNNVFDDKVQWNVAKELSALPHTNGLTQEMKEDILRALRNGDDVAVSLKVNGKWEPLIIRANPRLGKLDIFNAEGEKISLSKHSFQLVNDVSVDEKLAVGAQTLAETTNKENKGQSKGVKV